MATQLPSPWTRTDPAVLEAIATLSRHPRGNVGLDDDAGSRVDPDLVDAVARRVLELAAEAQAADGDEPSELLTVADVAARLRVTPKWVYAHQQELGAIRLGDGPKARLRFDPRIVDAQMTPGEQPRRQVADARPGPLRAEGSKNGRRRLRSRPVPPAASRRA
jgi:hypothetical protein